LTVLLLSAVPDAAFATGAPVSAISDEAVAVGAPPTVVRSAFEVRSLDGSANNFANPAWGQVGTPYRRIAPARYADGVAAPVAGPSSRYISNRVFNDVGQNIFSERGVSQWVWTWGQFMDHTFGLAQGNGEPAPFGYDAADPLESFRNDLGVISFTRDAAAAGSGTTVGNPRQQVNTVSSYIDGWSVYGGTADRQEWLRQGPVDHRMANNAAQLLLQGGYLPRASARKLAAPAMVVDGQLRGHPQDAVVAGDVRANENMALTAVHTLFAREHNRIVDSLPLVLTAEQKFQIARRVIGAEQQYVTYEEYLPALGIPLAPYAGYNPSVDATLTNEFATVAYRAHSMIHGEFDIHVDAAGFPPGKQANLRSMGVQITPVPPSQLSLVVPLDRAFFNPDLVRIIGLGPILAGLSDESQYKNDEQIDNSLRSLLFQLPGAQGVLDLGALDIERGRDHGMPSYNQLRRALGLVPNRSFRAITGEATGKFRDDTLEPVAPMDDPSILDFVSLFDINGAPVSLNSPNRQDVATSGIRRTTLAARLKSLYGSVGDVDAFVGMVAERHVPGSEMGQLQQALWKQQFEALRDGDRFFYAGDPALDQIRRQYGITYRHPLSELIALNAGVPAADLPANVFFAG
jgi:hypothetical protein